MIKDNRFFIVPFLVVLILSGLIRFKPLGEELYDLWHQEESLSLTLTEKEKAIQQIGTLSLNFKSSPVNIHSFLKQLQRVAILNQLQIFMLEVKAKEKAKSAIDSEKRFILKISLSGNFNHFFNFLVQLNNQAAPIFLTRLAFKSQESILFISFQVEIASAILQMIDKEKNNHQKKIETDFRDPFQEVIDPSLLFSTFMKDDELHI